jgi:lysine-specific demethylase 8/hypoxia-inducible factor 1-alpha inhibitor (HIF hydroxylase)
MKNPINNSLNTKPIPTGNIISRVDISSLTPQLFWEQYQKTGIPVIITGLLKDECDWTLDFLSEQLGDRKCFFRHYGRERYEQDKRQWTSIGSGVELQSMPFTEYAEMLRNGQAHEQDIYMGKGSIKNTPLAERESLKQVGSHLGLTQPVTNFNMYMGPGGHITSLHYDIMDNTLMQLHGTKKLVLFPPSQAANLYPFPISIHLRHGLKLRCCYSQIELENPDLRSFPKLKEALQHKYEVILEQGETLFIPSGWWHEVTSLGDEMVCSVNRFWRVYPTSRAVFSWNRWRSVLGNLCALPHVLLNLATTLGSSNRKQKLSKVLYKF